VLKQEEILKLSPSIDGEVAFFIAAKKVTDMFMESPLSIERGLKMINGFLEPLHLVLQASDLANEGIH